MKGEGTHELPASGGKHVVPEGADMPTRNTRKNLNGKAGGHDHPSKDVERGYTNGEKFGPSGKDNMGIKKTNPGSY
jgi:hypothetical protein